jgi:cell division protein FtsB
MSNLKESIAAIFQKFAIDPKAYGINLETEVNLEVEARLKDGTPIFTSAESFAIGVDVYTKDEEGNKMPAAQGRYELETGEFIDVNELGQIAEMGIPEMEEEMSSADLLSAIEKLTERVASLEGQNSTLNAELTKAEDKIEELSAVLKNTKTELSSLKKQPAAPSVKEQKRVVLGADKKEKSFAQMTLRERIIKNIENIK